MFTRLVAVVLAVAALQDTGVLRIRVALNDPAGSLTPIPRVLLLVSDNPATTEPRRVRTTADGTVELKLRAGSYTIESDQPIAFGGIAYSWTQTIDVAVGRETVVDLTATNAETGAVTAAPGSPAIAAADSATLLSKWQDSVVEIWTPTKHASGFVIDARGLIATSHRAIEDATDVEVEMTSGTTRIKVPGTVLQSDRLTGAAIIWIDPATAPLKPLSVACATRDHAVAASYRDQVTAIAAPMFVSKELIDGEVRRVTGQAIFADMRLTRDGAGGPVFASDGELMGVSSIAESEDGSRRDNEEFIVPIANVCETVVGAEKKLTSTPPRGMILPLEPSRANMRVAETKPGRQRAQPPALSSSDFDITLLTTAIAREIATNNPRADLANWSDYVRDAPPMLLIRVSPQFEESFWKMLARGAAATQGMALPPLKSFTSNFSKLRAFCGDTEVTPIHPFIIERQLPEKGSLREGLYVYDINALGPQCASVRLAMYSAKEPNKPDTKTIDPKLFEQLK